MPAGPNKGPQPACVEDYDDDRNTVLSATKVHARAGKDGSDSGYSSRTGTVDGEHAESGHTADLKSRPVQIERTRMPYSSGPTVRRRESVDHPKPTRPKVAEEGRPAREVNKKFRHPEGVCWTCDQVGYHVTQEQVNEIKKSLAGVKTSTTEKPKTAKEPPVVQSKDRDVDTKLRRMSSRRDSRPVMQYPPSSTQPMSASYATPAAYYNTTYAAPLTPTGYPAQPSYAYAAYPPTPSTSSTAPYVAQPPRQDYFPQYVPEVAPPNRGRRASVYYDPDFRQNPYEHYESTHPPRESTMPDEVVGSRRDARSQTPLQASRRDIEYDAYEEDRRRMPPPELPVERSDRLRRPSVKKYHTYDDSRPRMPYSRDTNPEAADGALERPPPKDSRDYYQHSSRQPLSVRTQELVPSKSSSSNRRLPEETPTRPKARQSVSYSHPHDIQTIAKSTAARDTTQRRVTTPITNMDAKVAEAEAYQQKRSSMASDDFSTEKIKSLKSSKAPTRSDAGSNYSHRESHYSSSKDSTGAKKARRDSIVIEMGSKSRPTSIQMPNGLTVQIGAEQEAAKEKEKEKRKSQKLLEHNPASASGASQSSASRSRAATSSHPSSDRDRDRDYQEKVSKRSSYNTDNRPPQTPVKTSMKSSRAPSRSRASSDADGSRRRRQSVVSERIVLRS